MDFTSIDRRECHVPLSWGDQLQMSSATVISPRSKNFHEHQRSFCETIPVVFHSGAPVDWTRLYVDAVLMKHSRSNDSDIKECTDVSKTSDAGNSDNLDVKEGSDSPETCDAGRSPDGDDQVVDAEAANTAALPSAQSVSSQELLSLRSATKMRVGGDSLNRTYVSQRSVDEVTATSSAAMSESPSDPLSRFSTRSVRHQTKIHRSLKPVTSMLPLVKSLNDMWKVEQNPQSLNIIGCQLASTSLSNNSHHVDGGLSESRDEDSVSSSAALSATDSYQPADDVRKFQKVETHRSSSSNKVSTLSSAVRQIGKQDLFKRTTSKSDIGLVMPETGARFQHQLPAINGNNKHLDCNGYSSYRLSKLRTSRGMRRQRNFSGSELVSPTKGCLIVDLGESNFMNCRKLMAQIDRSSITTFSKPSSRESGISCDSMRTSQVTTSPDDSSTVVNRYKVEDVIFVRNPEVPSAVTTNWWKTLPAIYGYRPTESVAPPPSPA